MLSLPQQLILRQKEIQQLKENFILLATQHKIQKQQNQRLQSIIHHQFHQLSLCCETINDRLQQQQSKILLMVQGLGERLSFLDRKIAQISQKIPLLKQEQKRSKNHIKLLKQKIHNNQEQQKLNTIIQEQKAILKQQKLTEEKLTLEKELIEHQLAKTQSKLAAIIRQNTFLQAQKHRLEKDLIAVQEEYKGKLNEAIDSYNTLYHSQLRQRTEIENLLNNTLKNKIEEMAFHHEQQLSFMRRRIRTLESEEKPKSYRIHKCSFKKGYH